MFGFHLPPQQREWLCISAPAAEQQWHGKLQLSWVLLTANAKAVFEVLLMVHECRLVWGWEEWCREEEELDSYLVAYIWGIIQSLSSWVWVSERRPLNQEDTRRLKGRNDPWDLPVVLCNLVIFFEQLHMRSFLWKGPSIIIWHSALKHPMHLQEWRNIWSNLKKIRIKNTHSAP